MRIVLALVGAVLLTGCMSIKVVWEKPGANDEDYARDAYACERDERMAGLVPGSLGAEGFGERCMEARGWVRQK